MSTLLRTWGPSVFFAAAPILLFAQDSPKLTYEQMERFLLEGKVVKIKTLSTGITASKRVTLDDGKMQHDAHVQSIDEAKNKFEGERGTEINFVDTWKYNVAAYRLARLLDLDMVPPSVDRKVDGKSSAVTWWVDKTMMETDRLKKKLTAPDVDAWNREMYMVRIFDQLIYNMDRNLQNLLIDPEWHIWMIDHTRAFRLYNTLHGGKDELVQCDRKLLASLRVLNMQSLSTLSPYVKNDGLKTLLARRDKIVEFFDQKIKEKGEAAVLYDRPAR